MRDEFSSRVKAQVAARAGWRCSNPHCRQPTSGPSDSEKVVTNVGVAAHITAASPNGPRFASGGTGSQRRSAGNAIWLCQRCAKAIDDDPKRYTPSLLEDWRTQAESFARDIIERGARARGCDRLADLNPTARLKPVCMLVVDDDGSMAEHLRNQFAPYAPDLRVSVAGDAGEAFDQIQRSRPDVVLLDLMMPYGSASSALNGDSDPDWIYAGLRLLERIREEERIGAQPIWVGVITAAGGLGTAHRVRALLGANGRLYLKPFHPLRLEHDVVSAFGITSKVPPELLVDN